MGADMALCWCDKPQLPGEQIEAAIAVLSDRVLIDCVCKWHMWDVDAKDFGRILQKAKEQQDQTSNFSDGPQAESGDEQEDQRRDEEDAAHYEDDEGELFDFLTGPTWREDTRRRVTEAFEALLHSRYICEDSVYGFEIYIAGEPTWGEYPEQCIDVDIVSASRIGQREWATAAALTKVAPAMLQLLYNLHHSLVSHAIEDCYASPEDSQEHTADMARSIEEMLREYGIEAPEDRRLS